MRRVPIRLRLALAFALAMGVVLAATGGFLYLELRASLDESIDESLDARMAELAPRVAEGDADIGAEQIDPDERFAQVFDLMGQVLGGTPQIGEDALLPDADALDRLSEGSTLRFALEDVPGISGPTRILAMPVDTPSGTRVLLVGASLEDRDETLREFQSSCFSSAPLRSSSQRSSATGLRQPRCVQSRRCERRRPRSRAPSPGGTCPFPARGTRFTGSGRP
jgi:hypothetical protein